MNLVFFALMVVVVGASLYFNAKRSDKRRRKVAEIASRHDLFFALKEPYNMVNTFDFDLFDFGRAKAVRNVMYGRQGDREVRAFDYRYTTGSGKNSRTYHWTCGLVTTGGATSWPHLTLGPETFFERIAQVVAGDDIDFESEEFNRDWEVRCEDRRFASAMIDPEMMLHLMDKAEGCRVEVGGTWVLVYYEQTPPEEQPQAIARSVALCERIPPVVWSLYPAASA